MRDGQQSQTESSEVNEAEMEPFYLTQLQQDFLPAGSDFSFGVAQSVYVVIQLLPFLQVNTQAHARNTRLIHTRGGNGRVYDQVCLGKDGE